MRPIRSLFLSASFAAPLALLATACCSAPAPVASPVPDREVAEVTPVAPVAPVGRSDAGVAIPESGFWERGGSGRWTYDLGVGMNSDVQLVVQPGGRGLVRVALPPGATGAKLTAITAMYAKNHPDMPEPPGAASGTAMWRVRVDEGGAPGAELLALPVTIDDANAAPLDDGNDGIRHALPAPLEVPATFWLVFEKTSGDPRIGAMRLIGDMVETYKDLYYLETPSAPLGLPKNLRPYLALEFADLGR